MGGPLAHTGAWAWMELCTRVVVKPTWVAHDPMLGVTSDSILVKPQEL